jgi:predicted amidohydrolase YtcJ
MAWPKTAAPGSPSLTSCRRRASARSFAGYPGASDETALDLATRAYAGGWQLAVQANGDAAIDQFLGAVRAAAGKHPGKDRRPLLVGAQTLRDDQLELMKELGIGVAFAPQRLGLSEAVLKDYTLGTERSARFAPAASAQRRGLAVLLYADPALVAPTPFGVMAAAIKRPAGRRPAAQPAGRPQGAHPAAGPPAGRREDQGQHRHRQAGRLRHPVGQSAQNPPEKLGEIRVTGTIKEGVTVFGGADGGVPILR